MITVQEKIDVLKMARGLIQEPDAWVQECHAWNHLGQEEDPESPDAVCFCLEGAIIRALTKLGQVMPKVGARCSEIDAEVMGRRPDAENICPCGMIVL